MEVTNKVPKKKVLKEKLPKDSDKYKVILKLINKILTNLEKPEIDDLTKFTNIDREDIIKDINLKALTDMEDELFPLFDKDKCGYYRKTNHRILTILRGCLKDMGYNFTYIQKEKSELISEKVFRRTHLFYSIK